MLLHINGQLHGLLDSSSRQNTSISENVHNNRVVSLVYPQQVSRNMKQLQKSSRHAKAHNLSWKEIENPGKRLY